MKPLGVGSCLLTEAGMTQRFDVPLSFGVALRQVRQERRLSLRGLQRLTQYTAGYLSELERGTKRPNPQVAQRCDDALRAGGLLLRLAREPAEIGPVDPAPARAPAHTVPSREFSMAADESARFVRQLVATPTRDLVDQLATEVRALAVDFLRLPPYEIFQPVAVRRREVFALLDGYVRPTLLTDLYLIAGQLTALLAHASADLGQPFAAEAHARTAWLCADLAGSNPLRAYVRWVQSNIAYWTTDYATAAQLAAHGERYACPGSAAVRLASQRARAWAAAGSATDLRAALADARTAREALVPEPDEVGVFAFCAAKSAYYSAEAWLSQGTPEAARRAQADAEESIGILRAQAQPCPELFAAARLDLAAARVALGDLDGAEAAVAPVLDLPVQRRTVPVVSRASRMRQSLAEPRFVDTAVGSTLRERITQFVAEPATRDLNG
jgi:transcriptional regulator with XRE-family HTH domain